MGPFRTFDSSAIAIEIQIRLNRARHTANIRSDSSRSSTARARTMLPTIVAATTKASSSRFRRTFGPTKALRWHRCFLPNRFYRRPEEDHRAGTGDARRRRPDRPVCRLRTTFGKVTEERDAEDLQRLPARHANDAGRNDQRRPARFHKNLTGEDASLADILLSGCQRRVQKLTSRWGRMFSAWRPKADNERATVHRREGGSNRNPHPQLDGSHPGRLAAANEVPSRRLRRSTEK
jgi:hypothetical protein